MINFFRKTRKKMADDNRPLKYMRYAIGEIALVVIGILIAISINNWNEWRKDRILESKLLTELVENLELNKFVLSGQIERYQAYNLSFDIILDVIQHKRVYHDSLDYHFHKVQLNAYRFDVPRAGYERLKNVGFEIIRNNTIRKEIINLFEVTSKEMINHLAWGDDDKIWKAKYMDEQFYRYSDKGGELKPFDFEYLLSDQYYFALLYKYKSQRVFFCEQLNKVLIETNKLIELIEENK